MIINKTNTIMRFILFLSYFLSLSILLYSQKDTREKNAETYFDDYSFDKSIRAYEGIKDKNIDIKRKLAVSYFNSGNYEKSKDYWLQVVEDKEHTPEDVYNYASLLAINQEYKESEVWMRKYYKLNNTDSRAQNWQQHSGFYNILKKDKGIFTIFNLDVNTKHQDFGTSYYKDKIAYASSREKKARVIKRRWNWNRLPFLDIYVGKPDSSMQLRSVMRFRGDINKRLHEGPVAFNKKGDFMVFTRNNYDGKSSDGVVKLQMFSCKYEKGKWSKPKPFNYNDNEYSVGHASLTAGGDTMYFASDMPGGLGGSDIYVSYRNSDGNWTKPENLGNKINTEGNEMFPFIHEDGTLYFSSNGLLGLGGLDVLAARRVDGVFQEPKNLGVPVNSSYDDFAFTLNSKQNSGYFSSNRPGGKGSDDIYAFVLSRPLVSKQYLRGRSLASNGVVLPSTQVYLLSEQGDTLSSILTGADGKYEFEVEGNKSYSLVGIKPNYLDGREKFSIEKSKNLTEVDVVLNQEPKFVLNLIVTDANTGQPIDLVSVDLADQNTMQSEKMSTSNTGEVRKELNNRKLQDELNFKFSLSKAGYIPTEKVWKQVLDHNGVYTVRVSMDEMMSIPPIYFDYNKHNIRSDASNRLDEVVELMNRYPNMVVELSSYTDCRGTERYNSGLSSRRAKSSVNYIRKRLKNNPSRIYGKGYGESNSVNDCACKGCSESEHQLNRRTEFVIKKVK